MKITPKHGELYCWKDRHLVLFVGGYYSGSPTLYVFWLTEEQSARSSPANIWESSDTYDSEDFELICNIDIESIGKTMLRELGYE